MRKEVEIRRKDLVYPELSYQILGILFEVFNEIGSGHLERVYQRAVADRMRDAGLHFQEQVRYALKIDNRTVGLYIFDFLVAEKIVLELKRGTRHTPKDIEQVYAYLRASKIQLGILAAFTGRGVVSKRVLNIL